MSLPTERLDAMVRLNTANTANMLQEMARLDTANMSQREMSQREMSQRERRAIARAHPPISANSIHKPSISKYWIQESVIRELCERIEEHGGNPPDSLKCDDTENTRLFDSVRRIFVPDEDLLVLFQSKKEDFDVDKVKKVFINVYRQLIYYCVDHCEDFGASVSELLCKRKVCVHKSMLKVLARVLTNDIKFQIIKEKPKTRKRRIEIEGDSYATVCNNKGRSSG